VTLFVSCSLPDFTFTPSKAEGPAHCRNFRVDAAESGIDCGGSECPKCGLGQACTQPSDCENGQCVEKLCQAASCANEQKDPGESDLDCGGTQCAPCPDAGVCTRASDCSSKNCSTAGVCVAATCEDDIQNGSEIALDCGGTCPGCPAATPCAEDENCASLECQAGACTAPCSGSLRECDGDPKTACETNTKTDPNHCGGCNQRCQLDHANAACSGGECQIAACKPPWDDCDGKLENGCETNLNEDPQRCGKCEVSCSNLNGTAKCVAGVCDITCNTGASNCDANSPGCESQTQMDVKNCGGCNRTCTARPGYTAFCAAGQCGETLCPDNFGNCNGVQADQCEANLLEDPLNCGGCGSKCVVEHGTAGCENGKCIVLGCDDGFGNCDVGTDGGYATGCETNTRTSLEHCGACKRACAIEHGTSQCEGGTCKVKSCSAPYQDCDGEGLSCSVNTNADDKNCGGCGESGSDCTTLYPNGSGKCTDGSCQLVSCKQNFDSCDNNPASGCETNLLQDEAHCGQCKRACQTTNAESSTCNAGVCAPACNNPAFGACTNPALGCVDSLDTRERCGSCSKTCSGATPFCVNRACADRMPISVKTSATQTSATNAAANMMYTVAGASGQYRLLLLAVATGAPLNRAQLPSAPTLKYGSTTTPFVPLDNNSLMPNGVGPVWVKHFYLLDAALPPQATAASVSLTMNNGTQQDPTLLIANLLEFTGVDQKTPFAQTPVVTSASGSANMCGAPNPKTVEISSALSGAFLYSLSAGEWWHATFADARSTQTLNVTLSADRLRAVGGFQGPVTTTSTSIGWGNSMGQNGVCNNAVHQIVVIRPALTP